MSSSQPPAPRVTYDMVTPRRLSSEHVRSQDLQRNDRRWHRSIDVRGGRGHHRRCHRRGRCAPRWRRARDDRRDRTGRRPRMGGHPHPLRRTGDMGLAARPVGQPRGHDRGRGQLRSGLRTRSPRERGVARPDDGGRRGHPRHGALRGHRMVVGDVPRVSRRTRIAAVRHGHRRLRAACATAHVRHG